MASTNDLQPLRHGEPTDFRCARAAGKGRVKAVVMSKLIQVGVRPMRSRAWAISGASDWY